MDVVLAVTQNVVCPGGDKLHIFIMSSWLTNVYCSFTSMFVSRYTFPCFCSVPGGAHVRNDLFFFIGVEGGRDGRWFVVLFTFIIDGFCQLQSLFQCTWTCEEVFMGFLVEVSYVHASWAPRVDLYSVFRVASEGPVVCGW